MIVEIVRDRCSVVRASGEIDLSNVSEFDFALCEVVRESPQGAIIDLSDVVYIDSAGIQAILAAYRKIYLRGGSLALVVENENMKGIFQVIRLDSLPNFAICSDLSSAERVFLAPPEEAKK